MGAIVPVAATNSTLTLRRSACYWTAAYGAFVQGNWKGLGSYGTLGLEMVLGVILPSYVGHLADEHYRTGYTFLLVGFAFGIAHAVRAVWRTMKAWQEEVEREEREEKEARRKYYEDREHPK